MTSADAPLLSRLVLSDDQAKGVDHLVTLIRAAAATPVMTQTRRIFLLAGAAGTGKTTLAAVLLDLLIAPLYSSAGTTAPFTWGNTRLVCPTWKAALRLRDVLHRLGILYAAPTSIHAAIYRGPDEARTEAGDLVRGASDKLTFSEIVVQPDVRFVVVDEASMPNVELVDHLLRAFPNAIILAIGDHRQLPPVEGEPGFDLDSADVVLDRIHRQAEGSPTIALAHRLLSHGRRSRDIAGWLASAGHDHGFKVVPVTLDQLARALTKRMGPALLDSAEPDTDPLECVAITPTNKTRLVLNHLTRKALGLPTYAQAIPVRGDVLLGLGNNPGGGWYNGSFGVIVNTPEIIATVYDRGAFPLYAVDVNVGSKGSPQILRGAISAQHWAEQAPIHWRPLEEQKQGLGSVGRIWFKQQQRFDEYLGSKMDKADDGDGAWDGWRDGEAPAVRIAGARSAPTAPAPVAAPSVPRRTFSAGSGYCITGHKSQGSQWKRGILLLDYAGWLKSNEWRYWYTVLTRFENPPVLAVPK